MALKLLLADDSLTAQNMGKKILVDAGYDVVAVSNGAAAVKKIAEVKPDLIILDVYMPGYTGLEVCERVKGAPETSTTPVLLTVGKMEPFKPEDGNRVHADGVVVKPFEATDLLAAVDKLSARLAPAAPAEVPEYERTIKLTVPLEEDASYAEWQANATPHEEEAEEKISVPDDMAAAPAAGLDLLEPAPPERSTVTLEAEQIAAAASTTPPPPVFESFEAAQAAVESAAEPAPLEVAPIDMASFEVAPPEAAPVESAPLEMAGFEAAPPEPAALEVASIEMASPEAPVAHAPEPELEIFQATEAAAAPAPAELEPTAAAAVGEVELARPEGFETTAAAEIPAQAVPATDSLLVTDATEMASAFPTRFGVEGADPIPVGVASEMTGLYADEQAPPATAAEDAPVDAPVLEQPAPPAPTHPPTEEIEALAPEIVAQATAGWKAQEENPDTQEVAVSLEAEMAAAMAAVPAPPALPEPGMEPVAEAAAEPAPDTLADEMQRAFADLPVEPAPVEESLSTQPVAAAEENEIALAMAAAVGAGPAATAATTTVTQKLDSAQIAQVAEIVHRITERYKAEMMAEILRELETLKH